MAFWNHAQESADWLGSLSFFEGFGEDELRRVLELSGELAIGAGTVIIDQGDPAQDCFVIVSGTASVFVRGEHVATLGSGSMIGEMAIIDEAPRSASVVADTDMNLLRFNTRQFKTLLSEMPLANERVQTLLSQRLRGPAGH